MAARSPLLDQLRKEKLTLLIENQEQLGFASDRPGLAPLRRVVFERFELVDGGDAALESVGLAAAYLLIHGKVGRVFCKNMTYEARRAFDDEGIEYVAGSFVRKLNADEPIAAQHALAKSALTCNEFVENLKHQIL